MVKEVSSIEEYKNILKNNPLVAVDYFATWCGPCRQISPKVEEFEKEFPSIVFIKVDVDKCNEIAEMESVSAMPTFKFFKNGVKSSEVIGASETKIKSALQKLCQ